MDTTYHGMDNIAGFIKEEYYSWVQYKAEFKRPLLREVQKSGLSQVY